MKITTTTLTAILVLLSTGHSIATAVTLRTVALSGDVAPGSGGDSYSRFYIPVLNDAGQTAFEGHLERFGLHRGIWSEGGSTGLALIALRGDVAPGTGDANFIGFDITPLLNDTGQTAFSGFIAGVGVTNNSNRGIWSERGGTGLALVAREGNEAPGTSGVDFSEFFPLVLNNTGQVAFRGFLTDSGVGSNINNGIWSEGGGTGLVLVARVGDAAPGTSSGVNFSSSSFFTPVLNDAGQTAFFGSLTGPGVSSNNNNGIWSEGGGTGLALVARTGDAASGTGSGVNFSGRFSLSPALNNAGQTAFKGTLTGTGVSGSNDSGIWSEGGGTGLALVVREGDAAPGTSNGVNFSDFRFVNPVLNGTGQTAFKGTLIGTGVSGSNDSGIWSEGRGTGLALVARTGEVAPGTGSAVFSSFSTLVLNDAGQTAFFGILTDTEMSSSDTSGIWAEDPSGVLKLIAREGDLLDVDDGPGTDFRTIGSLLFLGDSGNGDGRASGFNNLGQLAFLAIFTDSSSGIFVSNLAAIPEPATWVLAALTALGLICSTRVS